MPSDISTRSFSTGAWVLVVLVVGVLGYLLGARGAGLSVASTLAESGASATTTIKGVGGKTPANAAVDFKEFWDLWSLLKTKYHKQPLDEKRMMYGAMEGLAASTGDPYTTFFDPKVAEDFTSSLEGRFSGIGAEIGIKDGQLSVIAPLPETPAERAGLQPNDAILQINGTSTENMNVEQAVLLIRGEKGTKVTLSIGRMKTAKDAKGKEHREPTRLDVTMTRDTIVVKSVRSKDLADGIGYIQISNFNTDTAIEFSKAVDALLKKNPKGLVLDLRNDPGGFLDRATAVAGEWVGDDVVVSERRQGKTVDEYHGRGSARLKGVPTIVLVNEGSASASEIVAGALQDYGFAKLVGKKTFGKGSVQELMPFPDGSAVKITVAEWLTPKGRFINEVGIQPDVTVERTEQDIHDQRDPQLEKAIGLLTGASATSTQ